jgi:replicative DNA helicase
MSEDTPLVNEPAERAVLGSALMDPALAVTLADRLTPDMFGTGIGQTVWELLRDAVENGHPTDPTSIVGRLVGTPYGQRAAVLLDMVHEANPATAEHHAGLVVDLYKRRRLVEIMERGKQDAVSDADTSAVFELVRAELEGVSAERSAGAMAGDLLADVLDIAEHGLGKATMKTGWSSLDRLVTMRPGQHIVVAARPGVGKSTVGLNIAANVAGAASQGHRVAFLSLEMSAHEVGARLVSQIGSIPLGQLLGSEDMRDDSWQKVSRYSDHVMNLPLFIDDDPAMSLSTIRGHIRRFRPELVVVDYLQLVHTAGRPESRQAEVAAISRGLKLIAKEFGVVVMSMAQINRAAEHHSDKRPTMADIRESGAIEADADMVWLLHRPNTDEEDSVTYHEAELIVAKQRNGPTGVVHLGFDGECSRFIELARAY